MALSPYFNHFNQQNPEQDLWNNMVVESIRIMGIEGYYIPRTLVNLDELFGEDTISRFDSAYPIEMYVESIEGFEGSGDLIAKFGIEIRDAITLSIAKTRFEDEITQEHPEVDRPREGDLVYFPLSKGVFEIKFVEHENPFYQIGRNYVYKLRAELFTYSHERFDTGIDILDATESNRLNNNSTENDPFAKNDHIQDTTDSFVDFTEQNPFGTP